MNRYSTAQFPSTQLMTVEEAQRLSSLESTPGEQLDGRRRQQRLWSWQSIDGVLSQSVTDEQIERLARASKR